MTCSSILDYREKTGGIEKYDLKVHCARQSPHEGHDRAGIHFATINDTYIEWVGRSDNPQGAQIWYSKKLRERNIS